MTTNRQVEDWLIYGGEVPKLALLGDIEPVKDTIDYIPNSWVDHSGVRHAVVQEPLMEERMRLIKVNDKWELKTDVPF